MRAKSAGEIFLKL